MDMMKVRKKVEDINRITRKLENRLEKENVLSQIWIKNDMTIVNEKFHELLEII